jgi:RNA polymerase sigma-70 factor, ECF subfamily
MRGDFGAVIKAAYPRVVASLTRLLGDIDVAQDAAHDAMFKALDAWRRQGVPDHPVAWLVTVGRNLAIDHLRRSRFESPLVDEWDVAGADPDVGAAAETLHLNDDLLRLLFTCCHPALSEDAQITLTLRVVLDFSVAEIAAALLTQPDTVERRLTRAKARLASSGANPVTPAGTELVSRQQAVLRVVYLLFNHGYSHQGSIDVQRQHLMEQAVRLGRLLVLIFVDSAVAKSLLALMLLTRARTTARYGPGGEFVPLDAQDRNLWDWSSVREGRAIIDAVVAARHPPESYQIQAAIASLHSLADASKTDWVQIAGLFQLLERHDFSPVVGVNHAVALAYAGDPATALSRLEDLRRDSRLSGYQPLAAALAHVYRLLGQHADARAAYGEAIELTDSAPDRAWLNRQLTEL